MTADGVSRHLHTETRRDAVGWRVTMTTMRSAALLATALALAVAAAPAQALRTHRQPARVARRRPAPLARAAARRDGRSGASRRSGSSRSARGARRVARGARDRLAARPARARRRGRAPRAAAPSPDDPALTDRETAPGTPPGTPVQWWARADGPLRGVGRRARRRRAGRRHRLGHRRRPPRARRQDPRRRSTPTRRRAPAGRSSTRPATARTSPRWPARPAATASGSPAPGCDCGLLVAKTDFSDASVARGDRRRRRPRRRRRST